MQRLNLPNYSIRTKQEKGKTYLFDAIRKKYLVATPEEWVRQNFLQYLIQEKGFPASLMVIEKGLKLHSLKKRADILAYGNSMKPLLLVECKAPSVKIGQDTFDQIARYNIVFKVPFLIVTNGMKHYCCHVDLKEGSFSFLEDIPAYTSLI